MWLSSLRVMSLRQARFERCHKSSFQIRFSNGKRRSSKCECFGVCATAWPSSVKQCSSSDAGSKTGALLLRGLRSSGTSAVFSRKILHSVFRQFGALPLLVERQNTSRTELSLPMSFPDRFCILAWLRGRLRSRAGNLRFKITSKVSPCPLPSVVR